MIMRSLLPLRTMMTAACLLSAAAGARAIDWVSGESVSNQADDVYNRQTAIAAATRISFAGNAADDVFAAAGEEVTATGTFSNDLWMLSPVVQFSGRVGDHLRLAGMNVTVDGAVGNGVLAVANSLSVGTNAMIHGDIFAVADTALLQAPVEGNIRILARKITIGGQIEGSVHVEGDDILLLPGARIAGDLHYATTNRDLVVSDRVSIGGEIARIQPAVQPVPASGLDRLIRQFFFLLAAILVGIPFLLIAPRLTGRAVLIMRASPPRAGLIGIIFVLATPIAAISAILTLIGLPLGIMLAAVFALLTYGGKFVTAIVVGSILMRHRGGISTVTAITTLVAGLIVIYSLAMAPWIGPAIMVAASVFGAGSLITALRVRERRANPAETGMQSISQQQHTDHPEA